MNLDVYSYTNQGGRDHNEDCADYCMGDERGIFVVADGLGGHQYGELASACTVDTFLKAWQEEAVLEMPKWLSTQFLSANEAILKLAAEHGCTMKSTAVALLIEDGAACWAHAGDSRLYYIHDREMKWITADHSVAYKKYKAGEITREQLRTDEDQSSLLRTLGGRERSDPELCEQPVKLENGDAFLLCSDGAWEYFSDGEVLIDYLKAETAKEWTELLLKRILSRIVYKKNDNLTILTVMAEDGR